MTNKEKYINDLAYPITESSISVINNLLNECKANNIEIKLSTKVIDYQVNEKIKIITNNGDILCDKLIFSTGGKSSPKLGSDGTLFEVFNNHHYQINELKPGVCPIKTKENTKILDGTRIKGKVSLWDNDNVIYEENGEILFKDHGLSGIVIFNISSIIARFNYQYKLIKLDRQAFNKLKGKKIILNRSVLSQSDVADFEKESGSKVFYNMPNVDDKIDDNAVIKKLLKELGFTRIDDHESKVFSLFR